MIPVLLAGDGERDRIMIPPLLESLFGVRVDLVEFRAWSKIELSRKQRTNKGYEAKLISLVQSALIRNPKPLVVATVDTDSDKLGEKRRRLEATLASEEIVRQQQVIVIVGEANPHAEAWLLADPQAIREALDLDQDCSIPTIRASKYPKDDLDALCDQSRYHKEPLDYWLTRVARCVRGNRCTAKNQTGFDAFETHVQAALSRIGPCPPNCPCGDACPSDV
jgi:hypothetical protein